MIRSQVVVLNVIYDDPEDDRKSIPALWNWNELVDEPIQNAVELIAAGPVKNHPRPEEGGTT